MFEFTTWFENVAMQQLKNNITHLTELIDKQVQIHKIDCDLQTDQLPPEYLEFQVERCIDSFKSSIMYELKTALITKKFSNTSDDLELPRATHLKTNNTLIQKAKLHATAHNFYPLPQLAFLDIETDGVNINTANILQVAILTPVIDPDLESFNYVNTWSKYILPYEGYSQKDNNAYNINKIGDKQLKSAILMEDAAEQISFHLEDTIIVGYNVNAFDIPILKRHLQKYNEAMLHKFSIDLYPACWKEKKQKLGDAVARYNLPSNPNPHDATADASCCIDLLSELIDRNELPRDEEGLLDLFNSTDNIWQNYKRYKIIDINPENLDYAHLLVQTPAPSLKRKHSEISNP